MKVTDVEPEYFQSINEFSLSFLQAVEKSQNGESFAASPFGAFTTLTAFANAAEGDTLKKTASAMKVKTIRVGDLSDAVMAVQDGLYRTPATPLQSHNAVFMVWPIMLRPEFKQEMIESFGIDIKRLGSAGMGAKNEMNDWVSRRTNNQMPTMIDSLDKSTVFLALNPVTVGGKWASGFDSSQTAAQSFKSRKGETSVQMMRQTSQMVFSSNEKWQAVTLPYQDSDLRATFIMSKSDDVNSVLGTLTEADLKEIMTAKTLTSVQFSLPKFQMDTSLDLKAKADEIGCRFLFQKPTDLRYMSVEMQGDYELGNWWQRTKAIFEEAGGAPKAPTSPTQTIAFDRPFTWLIWEESTSVVVAGGVFTGQDLPK